MTGAYDIPQLRIATPADAVALASMHVAAWRETYVGLLPDKMLSSLVVEARAAAWLKIMQEPPMVGATVIHLALHDGAIIGFGSCGAQRTPNLGSKGYDGEVSAIYVLREFQKRGIGSLLLRAMCSDLTGRGFKAAALWVLRENLKARRFYEGWGGKVISEREDIRDSAVLNELAYGWQNLVDLERTK